MGLLHPAAPPVCAAFVAFSFTMKLTGFLMKLSGEQLIVELKNGTVVLGTVIGTDVAMNMHLKVVTLTAKGKNPVRMDALSIRGSNVRYIMCVRAACLSPQYPPCPTQQPGLPSHSAAPAALQCCALSFSSAHAPLLLHFPTSLSPRAVSLIA